MRAARNNAHARVARLSVFAHTSHAHRYTGFFYFLSAHTHTHTSPVRYIDTVSKSEETRTNFFFESSLTVDADGYDAVSMNEKIVGPFLDISRPTEKK